MTSTHAPNSCTVDDEERGGKVLKKKGMIIICHPLLRKKYTNKNNMPTRLDLDIKIKIR